MNPTDSTQLYDDMTVSEYNARYDDNCKKLLSHKIILAHILKHCTDEFKDCSVDDIAEKYIEGTPDVSDTPVRPELTNRIIGDNTEDSSVNEQTIRYDIKFSAIAPGEAGEIGLIINIEAQNRYNNGYPLTMRGLYYLARMISAQYGTVFTGSNYGNIRKVYSIWICMNAPNDRKGSINEYALTERRIYGNVSEKRKNYDLMKLVMVYLGDDDEEDHSLLNLLGVLFSETLKVSDKVERLEDDFGIACKSSMKEVIDEMCNLSLGLLEKGEARGILIGEERGMRIGEERGMRIGEERGAEKNTLHTIDTLMETTRLPFDDVARLLKISDSDRSKYKKLLNLE